MSGGRYFSGCVPRSDDIKVSSLFCVGRLNRIVICIPIQSPSTAAGADSQNSYPIAQILTVNQPHDIFGGGGMGIAHGDVEADSPNNLYPVHQSNPHQGEKSHIKRFQGDSGGRSIVLSPRIRRLQGSWHRTHRFPQRTEFFLDPSTEFCSEGTDYRGYYHHCRDGA